MDKINRILFQIFYTKDWIINTPTDGYKKECYIASNDKRKVFIKFDVPVDLIKRLGEINVAPKVLADGIWEGTLYIVQEFIDGRYPTRSRIKSNIKLLVEIIKIYHKDKILTKKLTDRFTTDYKKHFEEDLERLRNRFEKCKSDTLITGKIRQAFSELENAVKNFQPTVLTPIHNEPNTHNMLAKDNHLVFIDWDEITLSDPMRDIGMLLWWYLPENQWKQFFDYYGGELNNDVRDKIYWFAARASIDIALWRVEHDFDPKEYIKDFLAAINKQPNPHGY